LENSNNNIGHAQGTRKLFQNAFLKMIVSSFSMVFGVQGVEKVCILPSVLLHYTHTLWPASNPQGEMV